MIVDLVAALANATLFNPFFSAAPTLAALVVLGVRLRARAPWAGLKFQLVSGLLGVVANSLWQLRVVIGRAAEAMNLHGATQASVGFGGWAYAHSVGVYINPLRFLLSVAAAALAVASFKTGPRILAGLMLLWSALALVNVGFVT